jgi:hypothetical protein
LALEVDVPDSFDEFRTKFERALKEYTKRVKIESYLRCGLRTQSIAPVEMHFSELVKITQTKFLPHDKELLEIVGSQIDDYAYNIVTEKGGFKLHTICGPVKKEEMPRWYQPGNFILDPGQELEPIKYPDVAFFIDCDCYIENPQPSIPETFLERGFKIVNSVNKTMNEYIWR